MNKTTIANLDDETLQLFRNGDVASASITRGVKRQIDAEIESRKKRRKIKQSIKKEPMIIKQEPEDSFIMKTDPREDVVGLAQLENNNNLFKEERADSNEQKQHPPRIVMEPLADPNFSEAEEELRLKNVYDDMPLDQYLYFFYRRASVQY